MEAVGLDASVQGCRRLKDWLSVDLNWTKLFGRDTYIQTMMKPSTSASSITSQSYSNSSGMSPAYSTAHPEITPHLV